MTQRIEKSTDGRVGFAKRALNDARECGDACGYWELNGKIVLCVVDGLGHGEHAETAAKAALDCVAENLAEPLRTIFEKCNTALTSTRGAAMSIAIVDKVTGSLDYAGVGNVNIVVGKAGNRRLRNNDGIVGGGHRSLHVESFGLSPGDVVVVYTDGLKTNIALKDYDHIVIADPRRLAEMVLHDWRRGTDDAAVLVFRYEGG